MSIPFPQRDLIGYGRNRPKVTWPNDSYIAVSFVLNWEEGGESSVEHGDDKSEVYLLELYGRQATRGRDIIAEADYDYGSRVGVWRLLNLFQKHQMLITVSAVGMALEKNPAVTKAFVDSGAEINSHAYRWIDHNPDPEDPESISHEKAQIRKNIKVFQELTGKHPRGWTYGRSNAACQALVEQVYQEDGLDLLYWGDCYSDEIPFWENSLVNPTKSLLKIPYSLDSNDFRYHLPTGWSCGDEFFNYLKDAFDTLYEEGANGYGGILNIGLHCRISGKPGRFQAIKKFVEYVASKQHVWVCTREQIAQHWLNHHPPPR